MGKKDGRPRGRMSSYAFFVHTCREEHKKPSHVTAYIYVLHVLVLTQVFFIADSLNNLSTISPWERKTENQEAACPLMPSLCRLAVKNTRRNIQGRMSCLLNSQRNVQENGRLVAFSCFSSM